MATAKGPRCRNCKGPHPAISKGCPEAKKAASRSKPPTRQPLTSRPYYHHQINKNIGATAYKPRSFNDHIGVSRPTPYYTGQISYANKVKSPPREVIPKSLPKKATPKKSAQIKPADKKTQKPAEYGLSQKIKLAPAIKATKNFKNDDPSEKLPEARKNNKVVASLIKTAEAKNHELRFVKEDGHCFYHSIAAIYRHVYDVDTNFESSGTV